MPKISVLVVDDHVIVREGLKMTLSTAEDIEVVGESEDGESAVAQAKKLAPDVVLMDLALPRLNGLLAMRRILKTLPGTKVLVVSGYHGEQCVADVMKAGAAGFVAKETAATELVQAVRLVRRGNKFMSDSIMRSMATPGRQKVSELRPREVQVLTLIAGGASNRQMAAKLGISVKTVEKHRQRVMNKLNIHEAATLTRFALSRGLIRPDGEAVETSPKTGEMLEHH